MTLSKADVWKAARQLRPGVLVNVEWKVPSKTAWTRDVIKIVRAVAAGKVKSSDDYAIAEVVPDDGHGQILFPQDGANTTALVEYRLIEEKPAVVMTPPQQRAQAPVPPARPATKAVKMVPQPEPDDHDSDDDIAFNPRREIRNSTGSSQRTPPCTRHAH
eukprot:PhM_4_TR18845/c4_g1_i10/m.100325